MPLSMTRPSLLFALLLLPTLAAAQPVPPSLETWREWALDGQQHRRCPFWMAGDFGEPANHACAWPERLELQVGDLSGRFVQRWRAFADTWLPLPGDTENWPLEVRLDGAPSPVVERDGLPAVWVRAGEHALQGLFSWAERPEALRVPESVALVDLRIDGQPIVPIQRAGPSLWLGRPEATSGQADNLTLQVYRKLTDSLPPVLETRIALDVSGRAREELLGEVLPAGWLPLRLESPLPVLLGADGRLRAQLRPGNWQIVLVARGTAPLGRVDRGASVAAWPAEEIWSFEAQPELRVAAATGGRPVDPSQVDVPVEWRPLPAFVVEPGGGLAIEERSRGMAGDSSNRLRLERELWLDFAGSGLSARDRITGTMVRGFRLDLEAPFTLRRATADGEPLLVTEGSESGRTGVELRAPNVDVVASSRVEQAGGALPATGWLTPFESVGVTLHLPPARQLIATSGADASPDAWLDRWSLLDVFLLLVTGLLAGRLLGPAGGVLTLVVLGLGYQESTAPLWGLLAVLVLALVGKALPAGRLAKAVAWTRGLALLVLALLVLPFVVRQVRLALYPQLEAQVVHGAGAPAFYDFDNFTELSARGVAPPTAAVEPNQQEQSEKLRSSGDLGNSSFASNAALEQSKAARRLQRYAAMNVFQAGGGEPTWSWRKARLSWSGPVLPGQELRLWITPSWMTRSLRVLLVSLLGVLLFRLVGGLRRAALLSPWLWVLMLVGLGQIAGSSAATAQATPDPALLEELRGRLSRAPECVPNCGHLEEARVSLRGRRLEVTLSVHAAALIAAPLPAAGDDWQVEELSVDGARRGELLRQGEEVWLPLDRGVHRVELRGRLNGDDTIELRFPIAPGRLFVDSPGWEATGRSGYRLLTDTLSLVRRADADRRSSEGSTAGVAARIPTFVQVARELDLDLDWSATTRVTRLAPSEGSFTVEIPLLPGESVLTPGFEARQGKVTAALGAGVAEVTWESRLEPVDRLALTASDLGQRSETWRVAVSPQWHAEFSGVPAVRPTDAETYWVHEFRPLPGETLTVSVDRPAPIAGSTLAIDEATLESIVGQRAAEHTLSLALRSTRGGQHALTVPAEAEILEVKVDDAVLNVRPERGVLTIPVHPGAQRIVTRFREARGARSGWLYRMPAVDLGAAASNLQLVLQLPEGRWLLATSGAPVGPAVLFWGELVVMILAAVLLGRVVSKQPTGSKEGLPLSTRQWVLLGLGFATASWIALAVVVAWLLALEARRRFDPQATSWWRFDVVQLVLVGLTFAALGCLLYAVPRGLLGSPDMHVAGNGSTAHQLRWFADRTAGPLPAASALTLPLLVFRLALLAWALWLAVAVVRWLRWAYACLTSGGGWRKPTQPATPAASPPAEGQASP